jgi:hypothetical protein
MEDCPNAVLIAFLAESYVVETHTLKSFVSGMVVSMLWFLFDPSILTFYVQLCILNTKHSLARRQPKLEAKPGTNTSCRQRRNRNSSNQPNPDHTHSS